MSSDSSNPPSPRGVRSKNAGFDNGGMAPHADPQSFYRQQPSQTPAMRPPVGFSSHAPGVAQYPSTTPGIQIPQYHPGQGQQVTISPDDYRKKRREKGKDKQKSKSSNRTPAEEYSTPIPYASPAPNASTPFLTPPAFRVPAYNKNPPQGMPPSQHGGPYYHPDHSPEISRNKSNGGKNRGFRPDANMLPPPHGMNAPPPPDPRSMQPQERPYTTKADLYLSSADPPGFPTRPADVTFVETHHKPRLVQQQQHQQHQQPPPPPQRSREQRSNSTASNAPPPLQQHASSSYAPQSASPISPDQPSRPSKPLLRILTVLIEDRRDPEDENSQLAEVRVTLRPANDPDDGYWANAKEVCEELQSGPARIDGPAKVYAMRGKYRQYFLRVTADGSMDCQSANLKVTKDRTIEIFVEDNPAPVPGPPLLASPPPAVPTSASAYSPSRSEFGNVDVGIPRKRRHSASSRSSLSSVTRRAQLQSAIEEHGSHRPSPFTNRAPSIVPSQAADPPMSPTPLASHGSPHSIDSPMSPKVSPSVSKQLSAYTTVFDRAGSRGASSGSHNGSPMSVASPSPSPILASPVQPASPVSAQTRSSHPSQSPFTGNQSAHAPREREHAASPTTLLPGPPSSKKAKGPSGEVTARSADSGSNQWGTSRGSSTGSSTATPAMSGFAKFAQPAAFGASLQNSTQTPLWSTTQGSSTPSSSAHSPQVDRDARIANWLRDRIRDDPGWEAYVDAKERQQPPVYEMLQKVYAFVRSKMEVFEGMTVPSELGDLAGAKISKDHVLKAFHYPKSWWNDCTDLANLADLYGPNGSRCKDPDAIKLLDEKPQSSTNSYVPKCLRLLRDIDKRWISSRPGA